MQERIKEIATRLREMRELSDVSAAEMARTLNVSTADYAAWEAGEKDIPASVLYEMAQRIKVDMGLLLTGEAPRMHVFTVTRKDKGVSVERRQAYTYQSLAANFIHKKAEPFLVTVKPKPAGAKVSPNAHPGQEFNYLLEGRMKITIHDNAITLEPGDAIFFDSNYPHAMESLDDQPARFLAIIL